MISDRVEEALLRVDKSWRAGTQQLDPLASALLEVPDWWSSRVLLETVLLGSDEISRDAIAACCALEFLAQALRLGRAGTPGTEADIDDRLLVTDYFYAQAIDQVISLNKPFVIVVLARAIMNTAEDRATEVFRENRRRLIAAALEIGSFLGELAERDAVAVATAATQACSAEHDRWADHLPDGPFKDTLRRSLTITPG